MIPIAMYNAVSLGIEGIKPYTSPCQVVQNHFKIKKPYYHNQCYDKSLHFSMPLLLRTTKVSNTVIITPSISGMPNNRFIPIAIPNTSARSQAAIATSAKKIKNVIDKWRIGFPRSLS
jgi:hypothetical protein